MNRAAYEQVLIWRAVLSSVYSLAPVLLSLRDLETQAQLALRPRYPVEGEESTHPRLLALGVRLEEVFALGLVVVVPVETLHGRFGGFGARAAGGWVCGSDGRRVGQGEWTDSVCFV